MHKDTPHDEHPKKSQAEAKVEDMIGPNFETADARSGEPKGVPLEKTGTIVEPEVEPEPKDDSSVEAAVDDIVVKESDDVLAAEDAKLAEAFEKPTNKGLKDKIKDLFWRWWNNKKVRYLSIAGFVLFIMLLFAIPPTRYFILNNVGVRASSTLQVNDQESHQPLKNVKVSIGSVTALTDEKGEVRLEHIKLGNAKLTVSKRAFAEFSKSITVGWGSNPLGSYDIKAVGARYTIQVSDFFSGKPIEKAEASHDQDSAISDETGKILLTVDASAGETVEAVVKLTGYRDEKLTLDPNAKDGQPVKLVVSRKQPFVSKRSGKYDLYKIDVDGKNEQLVLSGTGNEGDAISLVSHPTDEVVALADTREPVRNKDGFLLTTLNIVDLSDNSLTKVSQSERVQVVGWVGSRLIYVQITAGASAGNAQRQKIISYDYKTQEKKELATSNSFNDLLVAEKKVYYSPSDSYQASAPKGMFVINADGTGRQTLLDKEVWNFFRSGYSTVDLAIAQDWYQLKIDENKVSKQTAQPATLKNRVYSNNSDDSQSLWAEDRDGKGALVLYNVSDKVEKTLRLQSGLTGPIRWLNKSVVVYRIKTPTETADYVLNIDGGDAKKIRDVTNTVGVDRWYYY